MTIKKVIALDLATKTGFAISRPETPDQPLHGTVNFGAQRRGGVFLNFAQWFQPLLKLEQPDLVVYEATWLNPARDRGDSTEVAMKLLGLAAWCEGLCERAHVECRMAAIADVRQHFIGTSRISRADAKRAAIRMCQMQKWNPADDNAAEALGILSYTLACLRLPGVARPPLFAGLAP